LVNPGEITLWSAGAPQLLLEEQTMTNEFASDVLSIDEHVEEMCLVLGLAIRRILGIEALDAQDDDENEDDLIQLLEEEK
jgi:hypothetical protein